MSARRRSAAALGASIVASALTLHARADEPLSCQKPEQGSAEECARVETFTPDFTQTLIPNNWMHATVRGFAHFTWNYAGTGTFRELPGFGFLIGIAPLDSQVLRISAGSDFVVSPRPDDAKQEVSVEPQLRVSVGNFGKLAPILPVDVYALGAVPVWTGSKRVGWGAGGGLSFRVLNRIAGEVGYEIVHDPAITAAGASPYMHRVTASIGLDLVALLPNSINHVAKATPRQIQIDLRCALLDEAGALRRRATHASTPAGAGAPAYCDDVMKALANDQVNDGERMTSAFFRRLSSSQPAVSDPLRREDDHLEACRQLTMRQQRRCVDCTGATIKTWPSYVMDPHQIAEALGCVPRADPEKILCDAEELRQAVDFAAACRE